LVLGALVKQGERTAGVKRHYLGCAGKVAKGITTVHPAYAREGTGTGHALIVARQWIPREHLKDPVKRRVMRLPPDLVFRTKGAAGHRPDRRGPHRRHPVPLRLRG
jgi:hypothetical protein